MANTILRIALVIFICCNCQLSICNAQSFDEGASYADSSTDDLTQELSEVNPKRTKSKASNWLGPDEVIRSHWVRLSPSGELRGKINLLNPDGTTEGIGSLKVAIYRGGKKVDEVPTEADGSFVVTNMASDVYSLIAKGPTGFAAYALHALESIDNQAELSAGLDDKESYIRFAADIDIKETFEISTAAVPPTFNVVKQILQANFKDIQSPFVPEKEYEALLKDPNLAIKPVAEEPELIEPEKEDPCADCCVAVDGKYRRLPELVRNGTKDAKTEGATSLDLHPVRLEADGLLRGRLFGIDSGHGGSVKLEAESVTVSLIQNDELLQERTVRNEGRFDFYNLDEGIYSLVAIGEGGFGAVSFRAVRGDGANSAKAGNPNVHFVQQPLFGEPNPAFGSSAIPFAMALINDPIAIKSAIEGREIGLVGQPRDDSFVGNVSSEFMGNEFMGNEFMGNEFMGEVAAPGQIVQPGNLMQPPATMGGPQVQLPQQTFQGVPGGGGFGGGLGVLAAAAIIPAVVAAADDDERPVSPAAP